MHSIGSLRQWTRELLPDASDCAHAAAWQLLRALLIEFTPNLCQLARNLERDTCAKHARQYLSRWLRAPSWDPLELYGGFPRQLRRMLACSGPVMLIIDWTYLANDWAVLQVSVAWEGRALPLLRLVTPRKAPDDPELRQTPLVKKALALLSELLPGPRSRYVVLMDRGFPNHLLIQYLREQKWRFVLRVKGDWRVAHSQGTGRLNQVSTQWLAPGTAPRRWQKAALGTKRRGRAYYSEADVVFYWGIGHREPWYLVSCGVRAKQAVAYYRTRMQIEGEFRDLKGPFGLDYMAVWYSQDRVERFLAWVAAYEWWLARLFLMHSLRAWQPRLEVKGKLSWIRATREWLRRQFRIPAHHPLACL